MLIRRSMPVLWLMLFTSLASCGYKPPDHAVQLPRATTTEPMRAGVAHSTLPGDFDAGYEAARKALAELAGAKPRLVLVFDNAESKSSMLTGIAKVFDPAITFGCSSYAPLTHRSNQARVAIVAFSGDFDATIALANVTNEDYHATGRSIGQMINRMNRPSRPGELLVLFGRSHTPKNDVLVKGVQAELGGTFPIIGGAAAQGETVYFAGRVVYDVNLGILLTGDFDIAMARTRGEGVEGVLASATEAFDRTLVVDDTSVILAFAFDCGGRRQTLGNRIAEELAAMRSISGNTPIIGFYGSGEIGPRNTGEAAAGVAFELAVCTLRHHVPKSPAGATP